ncbi:MAG TPA: exodeoxyribonuclease VII large subunit, partial [Bacilli bacterium]|nr:exodeoxyribonuclease VII large subunit [Bacilli bacterium]
YGLKNFIDIINRKYEQYKQVFEKLHIYSPLNKIEKSFSELSNLKTRLSNINLGEKISYYEQIIASNNNTMYKYMINTLKHTDQDLINAIDKLIILNPLNVLKKGYTIVYQNGKIVRQARDLDMALPLDVQFSDAIISTKIIHKSEEK